MSKTDRKTRAKMSATRRSFLRAVGAGAVSLPFYKLLEDSFAYAAGETLPLKLMVFSHPHGIAREYWNMRSADGPQVMVEGASLRGADTETDFDISYPNCSLQPFDDAATYGRSFKENLLLIEGLDLAINGHDAPSSILTGSTFSGGSPSNSSLDQYLAVELGLGAATRKSNVVLGVGDPAPNAGSTISYSTGGIGIGKIISPYEAFDYVFGGFAPMDDPDAQAAFLRRNRLGKSSIDAIVKDIARLRARLAPEEQQKMDQHLASIRDLEKKYSEATVGQSCTLPDRPADGVFPDTNQGLMVYNGGEPTFDAVTNFFIDLMAQAMACDITRFGTMVMTDLPWDSPGGGKTDSLGYGLPSDFHNQVAHTYQTYRFDWQGELGGTGSPDTWLPLATYNHYIYSKIARFTQKLDELGALDHTLVYATSEMGDPAAHSSAAVPTVLIGGSNVPFRFGRRLRMSPDCAPPNDSCMINDVEFASGANNHLLVSIAQAFGAEIDSFGSGLDSAFTTGTLDGLV